VRTFYGEAKGFFFSSVFVVMRWGQPFQNGRTTRRSIAHGLLSGPVAVVLFLATAPQFIPSWHSFALRQALRPPGISRLTRYCSLRPSCETKLVPIRVTSHWDRSRGIHETPRTEQGPQGSWRTPRSMQSSLELLTIHVPLPTPHPGYFHS
jgi:hypothetical protein